MAFMMQEIAWEPNLTLLKTSTQVLNETSGRNKSESLWELDNRGKLRLRERQRQRQRQRDRQREAEGANCSKSKL